MAGSHHQPSVLFGSVEGILKSSAGKQLELALGDDAGDVDAGAADAVEWDTEEGEDEELVKD